MASGRAAAISETRWLRASSRVRRVCDCCAMPRPLGAKMNSLRPARIPCAPVIRTARAFAPAAATITHTAPSPTGERSEEHTSELQSLMRTSYAVFCLKKKNTLSKLDKSEAPVTHAYAPTSTTTHQGNANAPGDPHVA